MLLQVNLLHQACLPAMQMNNNEAVAATSIRA